MEDTKVERVREAIQHLAAEFLSAESNRTSLITVTSVRLSPRGDKAAVCITVYPEDSEMSALEFSKRNAGAFREFVSTRLSLRLLPYFSFEIDRGEKMRQKLEGLSS